MNDMNTPWVILLSLCTIQWNLKYYIQTHLLLPVHQVSPTYKILYNCFSDITRSYWINSTLTQSRCVALLSLIYIFLFLSQILCTYILLRSLWKGICLYFVIKLDRLKFSQLIMLYWPKLWKIYICFVIK